MDNYRLDIARSTAVELFIALHEEQIWTKEEKAWNELSSTAQMQSLIQRISDIVAHVNTLLTFIANFTTLGIPIGIEVTAIRQMAQKFALEHNTPFGVVPNLAHQNIDFFDPIVVRLIEPFVMGTLHSTKIGAPEVVPLSDSFILLFLNIAQAVVMKPKKTGWDLTVWPPMSEQVKRRTNMHKTVKFYRKIREKHPTLVMDRVFDDWAMGVTLNEGQTIEQYIDNYDFGPMHPPESEWGPYPEEFERGEKGGYVIWYTSVGQQYTRVCRGHFTNDLGPILVLELEYDDPAHGRCKGDKIHLRLDSWVYIEQFFDTALYERYIAKKIKS